MATGSKAMCQAPLGQSLGPRRARSVITRAAISARGHVCPRSGRAQAYSRWPWPGLRINRLQAFSARRSLLPGRAPAVIMAATNWELEVKVHADYTDESLGTPVLDITFVDAGTGTRSPIGDTSGFQAAPFPLPYEVNNKTRYGVTLTKQVELPDGFGTQASALLVTKKATNGKIDRVYMVSVRAWPAGKGEDGAVRFLTNSWVADGFGDRIFFTGAPALPNQTPAGLKELRAQELAGLRGPSGGNQGQRQSYERVYGYDVYNDLVGPKLATDEADRRPILGKARGGTLPYPRRLYTGRPLDPFGNETNPPTGHPWLPLDEMFFASKEEEFNGGTTYSVGEAASSVIQNLFDARPEITKFVNLAAVDALYARDTEPPAAKKVVTDKTEPETNPFNFEDDKLREAFLDFPEDLRNKILDRLRGKLNFWGWLGNKVFGVGLNEKIVEFMTGLVATWPMPLVRDGRHTTWQSDEEVGRQAVAGCNPFTIQLATPALFSGISKVTAEDLKGSLNGLALEEAIEKKCIFWQDYHSVVADQIAPQVEKYRNTEEGKGKAGFQYAGRGIFFKNEDTGVFSIVAVELQAPDTKQIHVFTPTKDGLEIWELAKAVYSTLDSAVHQLISHFGETHAVMEPFAIATRRQLSALHPVYQLIMPCFHYTYNINANARSSLINANGVVEKVFTPGPFSLELSARMYGATWRFEQQGLPKDLESRGLAELDPDLKVKGDLVLADYPFAEDGLLVWNAIVDYFTEYLQLYYSDSGAGGKPKVTEDMELVAWYKEAREEGHPDIKEGWIELKDSASLVQILATMAWVGSAHHAAVNFGQYSYSGYMPNKASFIAHAIPLANSNNNAEQDALRTTLQDYEFEFLRTLSDPVRAVQTMLLNKLLSNHAEDEDYISGSPNALQWLLDPQAAAIKSRFEQALAEAESEMAARNSSDSSSRARSGPAGVPYKLMYPSVKSTPVTKANKGMTGCGIPYSVSI